MGATLRTELTLPNEACTLPIARAYLMELTALAGFSVEDGLPLIEAAQEACANVIDHAYEPGERGTLTLVGELTPAELILAVRDHGLPFDPDKANDEDQSRPRVSASDGLRRIRDAVDRVDWVHRGREGKELRLIKYRPQPEVSIDPNLSQLPEDTPIAPEQDYQITRMQPEHAVGVSRCIYRVYGNTYLYDECYYPERMARLNETGELVSCIALAEDGEVVGHYALERWGMRSVAERGMAVVSPAHRGRDLMGRMRIFIEEEARRLGLVGVFSVAVTKHVYSQKVNEEFGSDVCGVLLGDLPGTLQFKKIGSEKLPQRVSTVLYYTYVLPPPVSIVHAPAHHREVIERIYAGLKEPPTSSPVQPADMVAHRIELRDEREEPTGCGEVEVSYKHSLDTGTIRVKRIGADTLAEIRRARHDLFHVTGADVVFLEIPMAQPSAPALCEQAEGIGFFFAGVGPSFCADGDALILQCLNVEIDPSLVALANPFAKELLEYVERERARVATQQV